VPIPVNIDGVVDITFVGTARGTQHVLLDFNPELSLVSDVCFKVHLLMDFCLEVLI
jgi:hypothetical protein